MEKRFDKTENRIDMMMNDFELRANHYRGNKIDDFTVFFNWNSWFNQPDTVKCYESKSNHSFDLLLSIRRLRNDAIWFVK